MDSKYCIQGYDRDLLFFATERYKFCVLQWDAKGQLHLESSARMSQQIHGTTAGTIFRKLNPWHVYFRPLIGLLLLVEQTASTGCNKRVSHN